MKLVAGGSMRTHLNEMTELFNKLADIDTAVPEDQKVTTILTSVEPEYEALTTAIMAWSEERLNVQDVKDRLIEEWEKKKEMIATKEAAMFNVDKKKIFKCYGCSQPGHIKRNCPTFKEKDLREKLNQIRANKAAGDGQDYTNCLFTSSAFNKRWIIDSGATSHMTSRRDVFTEINLLHRSEVTVANGEVIEAKGIGQASVRLDADSVIKLKNVLWVPRLGTSLLSVRKFAMEGFNVTFDKNNVYASVNGVKKIIGSVNNHHYTLNEQGSGAMKVSSWGSDHEGEETGVVPVHQIAQERNGINEVSKEKKLCIHEWHQCLAHRNLSDIKRMAKHGLNVRACNCSDNCEHCLIGKMRRKPFKNSSRSTKQVLDCVVSDVCGPIQTESLGRKRYFITFIDTHSRYCEVKFIREKREVADETINYIERMKTQLNRKPKIFRSDRGTEYLVDRLQEYLKNEGIKFECTVGYAPEQNGMAERKNRTLVEAARCMLSESRLPNCLWAEAINTANYVTNRIIAQGNRKTPYETMFKRKPKWEELKCFGSEAYVMIPYERRRKLDEKSEKMRFVGYDEQSKGFRMFNGKRICVSREVHFLSKTSEQKIPEIAEPPIHLDIFTDYDDNKITKITKQHEDNTDSDIISINSDENIDEEFQSAEESLNESREGTDEEEEPPQPRRSTRANFGIRPQYLNDYVTIVHEDVFEPRTYSEAINSRDAGKWLDAIREELDSIEQNQTWTLVDLPIGKRAIGSKWVFKTKTDVNGIVIRRKARLVAQGFSQKYGVDYDEVFAPVVRSTTLRLLLSVAGAKNYHVKQYDIKSAFLNGKLDDEIYLKPPPGQDTHGKVYHLKKSLYGLKQAANIWNKTLHESLIKNGYEQNKTDNCLYSLISGGEVVHILIHVDDILAATSNLEVLNKVMNSVAKDFEMNDMGEVKSYLGIEMDRDMNGNFWISQPGYITKIIKAAGLTDAKTSKYPMDTGYHKLTGKELPSNGKYRHLIGMLLYLSTNSRPDIAASVGILSQRIEKPRDVDMNEIKRVVRYIKGTIHTKLCLSSKIQEKNLLAYSDSDWAENRFDRKSHSGFYCKANGGAIAWRCKKQDIVALSSAEAEYVALSETCKELMWIDKIARHLGMEISEPITVLSDSQSAIAMTVNQKFSHRTKHIDARYHFVKDVIERGIVKLMYHPTSTNVADMMTKPLGGNKIKSLRELGGLIYEKKEEEGTVLRN